MKKARLVLVPAVALLSGCAILSVLMMPLKLLFSALSSIGQGVGDLVTSVEPLEGPPPELRSEGPGRWAVASIQPESRFRVVFEAAGYEPRAYTWPDDFAGVREGTIEVDVSLRPVAEPWGLAALDPVR